MKPFFALYVKELKAHKILFLFVLLLIAGLNAYGLMQIGYVRHFKDVIESSDNLSLILWPNFSYFWPMLAVFTLVLSLPFLLAHTFNSELCNFPSYVKFKCERSDSFDQFQFTCIRLTWLNLAPKASAARMSSFSRSS